MYELPLTLVTSFTSIHEYNFLVRRGSGNSCRYISRERNHDSESKLIFGRKGEISLCSRVSIVGCYKPYCLVHSYGVDTRYCSIDVCLRQCHIGHGIHVGSYAVQFCFSAPVLLICRTGCSSCGHSTRGCPNQTWRTLVSNTRSLTHSFAHSLAQLSVYSLSRFLMFFSMS